jgi:sporulation protein YlmC with PRC-barrel domain
MKKHQRNNGMLSLVMMFALAGGGMAFGLNEQSEMTDRAGSSSEELLLNANTLIGNTVIDKTGKDLGTVKDLLIDQATGQISYIILAFGGTLGIGQENYSIPWKEVTLAQKDKEIIVQVAEAPIQKTQSKDTHTSSRQNMTAAATVENDFDPASLETMEGTVENVDNEILEPGVGLTDSLVVLDVKTATGKERVRLGPDDYLQQQGIEIKEGDQVEITGSRVTRDGENLILASKVTLKRDGKVLALRQTDGTPKWNPDKGINTKSKTRNE